MIQLLFVFRATRGAEDHAGRGESEQTHSLVELDDVVGSAAPGAEVYRKPFWTWTALLFPSRCSPEWATPYQQWERKRPRMWRLYSRV
jgi:hypothetical protein